MSIMRDTANTAMHYFIDNLKIHCVNFSWVGVSSYWKALELMRWTFVQGDGKKHDSEVICTSAGLYLLNREGKEGTSVLSLGAVCHEPLSTFLSICNYNVHQQQA